MVNIMRENRATLWTLRILNFLLWAALVWVWVANF